MDKEKIIEFYELSWNNSDIERKLGLGLFTPAKYTNVNLFISAITGFLLYVIAYYTLELTSKAQIPIITSINERIVSGGIISYITLYLFCWGLAILMIKNLKMRTQRLALSLSIVPQNESYTITQETAQTILKRLDDVVDNPKNFLLLNRIKLAISNLNNIGNVSDVSSVLSSQERTDEEHIDSSFTLINTLNWIIPILGFIGTVLGLGLAIGGFGETIKDSSDIEAIKESITGITLCLGTAFDTTLVALVLVVILQFMASIQMQKERAMLDEFTVYCNDFIISKLKITK